MNPISKYTELDPYFQDIDYGDIKTIKGCVSLKGFIAGMLSYYPWWIVGLYRVREILVRVLGLAKHVKPDKLPSLAPEDVSFTPGDNVTFFSVRKAKENHYWVTETPKDKHLTAYLGVVAEKMDNDQTKFYVFTSVKYKHWTGPVYFNIIRPFHHLVVKKMMQAGLDH